MHIKILWNIEENRLKSGWRVALQFILFLIAFYSPLLVIDIIEDKFSRILFDEFLTFILALASIWIFTRYIDKRKFSDLGYSINGSWFIKFFQGIVIGFGVFVIIFIIELSLSQIEVEYFNGIPFSPLNISKLFLRFVGFLFVAIMEETFSRGYQLKNIAEGTSIKLSANKRLIIALLFSSLIFGLMHVENPNSDPVGVLNLMLIGLFFGYAYLVTNSLALPIGLHASWNFSQANIFGFSVSGFESQVSLLKIHSVGNPVFTGGDFGPEAGVIIYIGILFGILFLNNLQNGDPFKFKINTSSLKYIPFYRK